jgi:DNA integrity scanning protein DisA with diadenylate cyclase activity
VTYIDWLSAVVVAGVAVVYVVDYVRDRLDDEPPAGTTAHAEWLFATDQISHAELERRVDVYEDPAADRIRSTVERISGIDTKTSFEIAARYDTLDDLQAADQTELEAIPNVGPKRATAIQERFV